MWAYFRVEIGRVKIDMIDSFLLDRRVVNMPWRRTEVTTMEISKCLRGANEGRLEIAVAGVDGLRTFEEKQT